MPTYEYECLKCGHEFELFQSINAAPKRTCPACRGRVKRLVGTGAGLLFKGSGFHVTDYRKPGYSAAASKDSGTGAAAKTEAGASVSSKESSKPSTTKTIATKE
jgi:putative FmdB family regulatory protein